MIENEPKVAVNARRGAGLRSVSPIHTLEEVKPGAATGRARGHWLMALVQARGTAATLLVIGACLLVTGIWRHYDQWKSAQATRRELLERYLLYMNLTWDEYNLLYPLVAAPLTYERYSRVMGDISTARSRRLNSFARLQMLAISLRAYPGEGNGELEFALFQSDVRASRVSGMVDDWIRNSYCMHNDCVNSRNNFRDLKYPQYDELMKIRETLMKSHTEDWKVVELIERQIEGQ